jgi:hypothetical protein
VTAAGWSRRGIALVGLVALAGVALVVAYVALGGGRYTPFAVADPCAPREWRDPEGTRELAEQVALSALDGAACDLGVPRERVALAVTSEEALMEFMAERGVDEGRVEEALRRGLHRAIDDGERAGALNRVEVFVLEQAVDRLPVDRLVEAYRDGDLDGVIGLVS